MWMLDKKTKRYFGWISNDLKNTTRQLDSQLRLQDMGIKEKNLNFTKVNLATNLKLLSVEKT